METKRIIYCPRCQTPTELAGLGDYEICLYCGWKNLEEEEARQ